jgi:hypothetical protein
MDDEEPPGNGRFIHRFTEGHPRRSIIGHRIRTHTVWPRYLVKRVPDINAITDKSALDEEEKNELREEYWRTILHRHFEKR